MVNFACAFSQSKSVKYFEWIIHYINGHKRNHKKTGWGPPHFQLSQEKTLKVRSDLIAIEIKERANWIYEEGVGGGGAVNVQLNGPKGRDRRNEKKCHPRYSLVFLRSFPWYPARASSKTGGSWCRFTSFITTL